MTALAIIRFLVGLRDVDDTNIADGFVLVARPDVTMPSGFVHEYEAQSGGGGGPPSGPAGGVLGGTYPNPAFAVDMATQAELDAAVAGLVPTARTLTAGDGLSGGGDLSANRSFAVNVDNASIEISADTLQVKANGITVAMLNFDPATQAELDAAVALLTPLTTFNDHSARHENGGADEITVAGLSGELADAQPVAVHKNGAIVGTRSNVNFIEGTNVTLTITDDGVDDEVDVTIAATGSSATCDDESCIIHMQVFA